MYLGFYSCMSLNVFKHSSYNHYPNPFPFTILKLLLDLYNYNKKYFAPLLIDGKEHKS